MKSINIVTVYFGDDWKNEIPLLSAETTRKSFEDWHQRGQEEGINFYRASISWFDLKSGTFRKSWAFREGKWIKIKENINPDLIFDKIAGKHDYRLFSLKEKIAKNVPTFNDPNFRTLFNSKLNQAVILEDFMAKSFLATNIKEYNITKNKIPGSMVVIKPIYGSGGFGIVIDDKKNIKEKEILFPCIVQEFIENTVGIPGFSSENELADLRMVYLNHSYVYSLSRIAKKGSLFTNFHQGAVAKLVPEDKIPDNAKKMAEEVIKKLSFFPYAHYSLDFMFRNNGDPVLVEMNTTPGFDLVYILDDKEIMDKNYNLFIKTVREILQDNG